MNWKIQAGIIISVIALFAAMAFIIKTQHDSLQKQKSIEESIVAMKQLSDGIARNQAQYATKQDVEKFASDSGINLDPIKEDIKKLDANITAISVAVSNSSGYKGTNLQSTSTTPRTDLIKSEAKLICKDGTSLNCPNPDTFGYLNAEQNLDLNEPFGKDEVPLGKVGFSAWKQNPWELTIYPRQYHIGTVLAVDENNRHFAYSQFWIESDGKRFNVQINNANFVEEYPSPKFRFSPALFLGIDFGVIVNPPLRWEITPNLQLALFSYGKTKVLPSWTFVGLGVGYETQTKTLGFLFSPINYNLGDILPLINNLYVGPSIGLDVSGNFSILGGVRVGL